MKKRRGFPLGDPRAATAGSKGGMVRGHQIRLRQLRAWQVRYPEVPPALSRAIWRDGYDTGYHAGRRNTTRVRW